MVDEPLVYLLTVLLAVSAGLGFGVKAAGVHRWLGCVAGILVVAFVVVVGFMIGARAVWIGPIFFLVSMVTTVMVGASVRRNEPMFLASSYWRRILLVGRGYKSEPAEASGDTERPPARVDHD